MEFSPSAFEGILEQLEQAAKDLPDTQERMMSLSGVGWSDDGMVKVVVGPRGQLTDVEIDPKVFRKPDSKALQASILAASATAIAEVSEQVREIMTENMLPDMAELRQELDLDFGTDNMDKFLRSDAELIAEREESDG